MKFNRTPSPRAGERRLKSGFLIFPKTINNVTRWLEYATWEVEYYGVDMYMWDTWTGQQLGFSHTELVKNNTRWIDDTNKLKERND